MDQNSYTEEQRTDINDRVAKAVEALKELQLSCAAVTASERVGDNVFGIKVIPYLKDLKYEPAIPSPIQQA